jgi:hypothetical protein
MFAVFAAPLVSTRLVALRVEAAIVNAAIAPDVAVSAPPAVTRNAAVARSANVLPAQIAMSPLAAGDPRPPAVAPVPTVMFAVFAAPLVSVKFVALMVVAAIVNAAIAPLVAVSAPAAVTRNTAVARFANVLPAQIAMSLPVFAEFSPPAVEPVPTVIFAVFAAPLVSVRFVALMVVAAIVNAAIAPDVAVIAPAGVTRNGAVARFEYVAPA